MILLELFLTFFKIGAFTFGGGYAMLPLMQQEVLANKWLSEEEIIAIINTLPDKTMPTIMKHFKSEYAGKVDMALVNKIARG